MTVNGFIICTLCFDNGGGLGASSQFFTHNTVLHVVFNCWYPVCLQKMSLCYVPAWQFLTWQLVSFVSWCTRLCGSSSQMGTCSEGQQQSKNGVQDFKISRFHWDLGFQDFTGSHSGFARSHSDFGSLSQSIRGRLLRHGTRLGLVSHVYQHMHCNLLSYISTMLSCS